MPLGPNRSDVGRLLRRAGQRGGGGGFAAAVVVVEGTTQGWEVVEAAEDRTVSLARGVGAAKRYESVLGAVRGVSGRARMHELSRTLVALGHPWRVLMLIKLLEGPSTYRGLHRITGLKAGPLYHHINQLRLAGLLRPKQRDLYDLTRGGRNVILGALALTKLAKDTRARVPWLG